MAYRFKCPDCDRWHDGLPDVGYRIPDCVNGLSQDEWSSRVKVFGTDLCILDNEDFFIRVTLPLTIREIGENWAWGVWTTLSKPNFERYADHFDDDMSDWDPMFGWLSNRLPDYPDTLNLKLSVQPGPKGLRPTVTVEPSDHPLSIEQRDGIALERVLKFCGSFLHG